MQRFKMFKLFNAVNLDAQTDLMHSFPKDVFILFLIDVFALVVRFDGKLHLLNCPLLGV